MPSRVPSLLASLVLAGCTYIGEGRLDRQLDQDGDGVTADLDCDPDDGTRSLDDTRYQDLDGDGIGGDVSEIICGELPGWVTLTGDCDDTDAAIQGEDILYRDADGDLVGGPISDTICGSQEGWVSTTGDCDDNDVEVTLEGVVFVDADGDGVGSTPEAACGVPEGFSEDAGDCNDSDPTVITPLQFFVDGDGDGHGGPALGDPICQSVPPAGEYAVVTDCNDSDPHVHPGADEFCGGVDEDCDGLFDDDPDIPGEFVLYLPDLDGDGVGDAAAYPTAIATQCPPAQTVAWNGDLDCNEADATIAEGFDELCDGLDNNCDGEIDEALNQSEFWPDLDQDGSPDVSLVQRACSAPSLYVAVAGFDGQLEEDFADCDDDEALAYPWSVEVFHDDIDNDCDPQSSDDDEDGDGYDAVGHGGADCDDLDPDVNPGAFEVWYDDVDDDCLPENDFDQDGDGYLSAQEPGPHGLGDDCDDTDAAVNPGANEVFYDGVDDDCDPSNDDDFDGDGYAAIAQGGTDCNDAQPFINPGAVETPYDGIDQDCVAGNEYDADGDGYNSVAFGGLDCDDAFAAVNPDAVEVYYDNVDDDCDPTNDDDADGDGYNSVDFGGTDCDDSTAAIAPNAPEVHYDAVDDDCDPNNDFDADGDGFDSAAYTGPHGVGTDCDDDNPAVNPLGTEVFYDGVDDDCDPGNDDDADNDGFSSVLFGGQDCDDANAQINPNAADVPYDGIDQDCDHTNDDDADRDGYDAIARGGTDCDDQNALIYPSAGETHYDGIDQDCNPANDDDADLDGFLGQLVGGDDCNDGNPQVFPGQIEVWYNNIDDACDGGNDFDQDGDGVTSDAVEGPGGFGNDCDDLNPDAYPGAPELVETSGPGIDNDCSGGGFGVNCYEDDDGDGFGAGTVVTLEEDLCDVGFATQGEDCDDEDRSAYPGAVEFCDGVDTNCNGAEINSGASKLEATVRTALAPGLHPLADDTEVWICGTGPGSAVDYRFTLATNASASITGVGDAWVNTGGSAFVGGGGAGAQIDITDLSVRDQRVDLVNPNFRGELNWNGGAIQLDGAGLAVSRASLEFQRIDIGGSGRIGTVHSSLHLEDVQFESGWAGAGVDVQTGGFFSVNVMQQDTNGNPNSFLTVDRGIAILNNAYFYGRTQVPLIVANDASVLVVDSDFYTNGSTVFDFTDTTSIITNASTWVPTDGGPLIRARDSDVVITGGNHNVQLGTFLDQQDGTTELTNTSVTDYGYAYAGYFYCDYEEYTYEYTYDYSYDDCYYGGTEYGYAGGYGYAFGEPWSCYEAGYYYSAENCYTVYDTMDTGFQNYSEYCEYNDYFYSYGYYLNSDPAYSCEYGSYPYLTESYYCDTYSYSITEYYYGFTESCDVAYGNELPAMTVNGGTLLATNSWFGSDKTLLVANNAVVTISDGGVSRYQEVEDGYTEVYGYGQVFDSACYDGYTLGYVEEFAYTYGYGVSSYSVLRSDVPCGPTTPLFVAGSGAQIQVTRGYIYDYVYPEALGVVFQGQGTGQVAMYGAQVYTQGFAGAFMDSSILSVQTDAGYFPTLESNFGILHRTLGTVNVADSNWFGGAIGSCNVVGTANVSCGTGSTYQGTYDYTYGPYGDYATATYGPVLYDYGYCNC